ncbi:hypothetical protein C0Q70_19482 [Pomacea canaliculata]|uniref:Conodipine-M alpha chain n=1 Tax=Pomacea canaliculata TaxID=400727 RepID=A0A2T7NJG7_POMCA|nr:uncharacterized protein LOC112577132 [Pomacea canaliculata]PVD21309.1 hypothetical protein C0Q70_19482 [Pomacea canaliculata]
MTSLRVLGVLVALGLISVIVGSEERRKRDVCTDHSNGCSIPGNLPFFYKATFTPSCDRHDVCYRCGAMAGISRSQCDSYFHANMLRACAAIARRRDALSREERSACTSAAEVYYSAVHLAGALFYKNAGSTEPYCTTSLIHSCVP